MPCPQATQASVSPSDRRCVPKAIGVNEDEIERELEVRFLDWEFGKDAVAGLTEEESFVPEKI